MKCAGRAFGEVTLTLELLRMAARYMQMLILPRCGEVIKVGISRFG